MLMTDGQEKANHLLRSKASRREYLKDRKRVLAANEAIYTMDQQKVIMLPR